MNDPFIPLEVEINLAGRALAIIAEFGFPVHIITKRSLILKGLHSLTEIARAYAGIGFTLTTAADELAAASLLHRDAST
jgi:DNA repair photolyase